MFERFKTWCGSDTASARTTRTIFQGVIGVIIANIDMLLGTAFDPEIKVFLVALTMAVLSPIQAAIGQTTKVEEE